MTRGSAEPGGPWYREGLRFVCQDGCNACCRGPGGDVWLTRTEAAAIAAHIGETEDDFMRMRCRLKSARWSLRGAPVTDDCLFLDREKGCTIYDVRPRQCRTFPFWEENVASEAAWSETTSLCPGCGQGALYSRGDICAFMRGRGEPD